MREKIVESSVVILNTRQAKIGNGFMIHESGLLATCYHMLNTLFPNTTDYTDKEIQFAHIENDVLVGWARVYRVDHANDLALLQIQDAPLAWLKPIALIATKGISQQPFSIYGYAELDTKTEIEFGTRTATGKVDDTILINDNTLVLQLSSENLLRGMSGSAIFCKELNGVVGMQSIRLNFDPTKNAYDRHTGLATRSEAIFSLAPDILKLNEPNFANTRAFVGQSSPIVITDAVGLKSQWMRPAEFDAHHRHIGAIRRTDKNGADILQSMNTVIGAKRAGTGALALWGQSGIGKSTLASLYVAEYGTSDHYPGGVLWVELGAQFDPTHDVAPIFERWLSYVLGGESVKHLSQNQRLEISPDYLRTHLSNHGELLVVFDDLAHPDHLKPFLNALPQQTNWLITTTSQTTIGQLGISFESYQINPMTSTEAQNLLAQKLPALNTPDLDNLAKQFGYHPQALVLVASSIQQDPDPRQALMQLSRSQAIGNIHEAYAISYRALNPSERDYLVLLSLLKADGFDDDIAGALWDEPKAVTHQILARLHQRSLVMFNDSDNHSRWSIHVLMSEYLQNVAIDSTLRDEAEYRYVIHILKQASDIDQWRSDNPNMPHFRGVIGLMIDELERIFHIRITELALEQPMQYQVNEQQERWVFLLIRALGASFDYILLRPEGYELGERWMRAYILACASVGYHESSAWGWIALARWYLLGESIEKATHVIEHALQIGYAQANPHLVGYALLVKSGLLQRQGNISEAIQQLQQAYEDTLSHHDPELDITLLTSLSALCLTNFTYDKAKFYLEEALAKLEDVPPNPYLSQNINRQLGFLYIEQNRFEEGVRLLNEAKQIASSLGDDRALAELTVQVAHAYQQQGNYDMAKAHLDDAEQDAKVLGYHRLNTHIAFHRGVIELKLGNLSASQSFLDQTQRFLKIYPDKPIQAQTFAILGELSWQQGNPNEALEALKYALPLMRDMDSTQVAVNILNTIGTIYEQTGRINEGIDFFKEQLPLITDLNNKGAEVTALNWLTMMFQRVGDVGQALKHLESAHEMIDKLENRAERATVLTITGAIYQFAGRLAEAFDCFSKVEADWRSLNNRIKWCDALMLLANIQRLRGEIASSQSYLDELEKFLDDTQEAHIIRVNYLNMRGVNYVTLGELSSAKKALEEAMHLIQAVQMPELNLGTLNNLALMALANQDIQLAIDYFAQALYHVEKLDIAPQKCVILTNLGWMYALQGKLEEGVAYFNQAISILEKSGFTHDAANQTSGQIQNYIHIIQENAHQTIPIQTLRFILESVNWETIRFMIRARHELLLSSATQAILTHNIYGAEKRNQPIYANVLRTIAKLLKDCQGRGLSVLSAEHDYVDANLRLWWSQNYRMQGNYHAALQELNQSLTDNPNHVDGLIERGWVYRGLGQWDYAIQNFEKALSLSSKNYRIYQGLGVVYYEIQKYKEALVHLTTAIQYYPHDAYTYQWRGAVYVALNDLENAEKDMDEAVHLSEDVLSHRYWRSIIKIQQKEFGKARDDLDILVNKEESQQRLLMYNLFWRGVAFDLFDNTTTVRAKADWDRGFKLATTFDDKLLLVLYHLIFHKDEATAQHIWDSIPQNQVRPHVINQMMRHIRLLKTLYPELIKDKEFMLAPVVPRV